MKIEMLPQPARDGSFIHVTPATDMEADCYLLILLFFFFYRNFQSSKKKSQDLNK